ncbi:MAG: NTP transferase domain-containing protein [Ardenticatenaceae bacterium]|nr:nucleotidyltransferase family protein [Anaerolineales bacterium]MCB8941617.1 NTP transferase domain-containing protein [Ardenticatenaceae bacterium]MCB8974488.1 NTP transferase domain-containing protein [Ardenticatenaceae bacterium]
MTTINCVVLAGGLPEPGDPLYELTQGKSKALLDMNGRTMLERVVDALQDSHSIGEIVVVGLSEDLGMTFHKPVYHTSDYGSLFKNALGGIAKMRELHPETDLMLICSADIPTITPQIVDEFIELCAPYDKGMVYNFVDKETLEARFPHSNRTYVKLKDGLIAGGDMTLIQADLSDTNRDIWLALTNARKHAWQLARVVGFRFMIKLLLRQLRLKDIEDAAFRITGRPCRVLLNPHAEIAMDADKPEQVALLRADLSKNSHPG